MSMTTVKEKYNEIHIEYEHTIATAQFENMKPKLSVTVNDWDDVGYALSLMRHVLQLEDTQVKSNMNRGDK